MNDCLSSDMSSNCCRVLQWAMAGAMAILLVAEAGSQNLVPFGDFNGVVGPLPYGWKIEGKGRVTPMHVDGDFVYALETKDPGSVALISPEFPVKSGETYRLSAEILPGYLVGRDRFRQFEWFQVDTHVKAAKTGGGAFLVVRFYDDEGNVIAEKGVIGLEGGLPPTVKMPEKVGLHDRAPGFAQWNNRADGNRGNPITEEIVALPEAVSGRAVVGLRDATGRVAVNNISLIPAKLPQIAQSEFEFGANPCLLPSDRSLARGIEFTVLAKNKPQGVSREIHYQGEKGGKKWRYRALEVAALEPGQIITVKTPSLDKDLKQYGDFKVTATLKERMVMAVTPTVHEEVLMDRGQVELMPTSDDKVAEVRKALEDARGVSIGNNDRIQTILKQLGVGESDRKLILGLETRSQQAGMRELSGTVLFPVEGEEYKLSVTPLSPVRASLDIVGKNEGKKATIVTFDGHTPVRSPGKPVFKTADPDREISSQLTGDGWSASMPQKTTAVLVKYIFDLPDPGGDWKVAYAFSRGYGFGNCAVYLNGKEIHKLMYMPHENLRLAGLGRGHNELVFYFPVGDYKPFRYVLLNRGNGGFHAPWQLPNGINYGFVWPETTVVIVEETPKTVQLRQKELGISFSRIRPWEILDDAAPTGKKGHVVVDPGDSKNLIFDKTGTRARFWGGHENHVQTIEQIEKQIELCRLTGVNVLRWMFYEDFDGPHELRHTPEATAAIQWLVHRMGQTGIYMEWTLLNIQSYRGSKDSWRLVPFPVFMTDPKLIDFQKQYASNMLNMVNPYNGRRIIEDPTIIFIEITNETPFAERGFDFNGMEEPYRAQIRERWNQWLLKKYGSRGKLAAAWAAVPLTKEEDPAGSNILFPENFATIFGKGSTFFLDQVARLSNPRCADASEFVYTMTRNYLAEIVGHIHRMGFKGLVGWNGPSTSEFKSGELRAAILAGEYNASDFYWRFEDFSSLKSYKNIFAYQLVQEKPCYIREWGAWGPDNSCGLLFAAIMGKISSVDGWAHHKQSCNYVLPRLAGNERIHAVSDLRRGGYTLCSYVQNRSTLDDTDVKRIVIANPFDETFSGGLNSPIDAEPIKDLYNTLLYNQIPGERWYFDEVYNGPKDTVVFHEGRAPAGDYRSAAHAILWAYDNSSRAGNNPDAREKWFALHGLTFKKRTKERNWGEPLVEGIDYILSEKFLGLNVDVVDDPAISKIICHALKSWDFPLNFDENEIGKTIRLPQKGVDINTDLQRMLVERKDFELWMGKVHRARIELPHLTFLTEATRANVGIFGWDTPDLEKAKVLAVWATHPGQITLKGDRFTNGKPPGIYSVNWCAGRKHEINPKKTANGLAFQVVEDWEHLFCYEVVWE